VANIELTAQEKFEVRGVEASELRAHNRLLDFKMRVEAEFKALQDDATAKSKVTTDKLKEVARTKGIEITEYLFDFETLTFLPKSITS
jgi:hypothetical protein